jgi:hypothetical protein
MKPPTLTKVGKKKVPVCPGFDPALVSQFLYG